MGISFLMLGEKNKSRGLEGRCCNTDRTFPLREGPMESIENTSDEVSGSICIKDAFTSTEHGVKLVNKTCMYLLSCFACSHQPATNFKGTVCEEQARNNYLRCNAVAPTD